MSKAIALTKEYTLPTIKTVYNSVCSYFDIEDCRTSQLWLFGTAGVASVFVLFTVLINMMI
ncbi:hypothetical protein [Geomicrobium sp. JCM 19055]|uniref:hypothetical protein n=1 Tax=Geomicrobium sp. JCM 19055 TaxID=1460649 RepID=UPI0012688DB2|nr:hypothetical protein [Geomicrobium sp. JCM 19055]